MEMIKALNVAVVGGGPGCKAIMDMIFSEKLSQLSMKLIGMACTNPEAVGYRFAQEKGIYTTTDYHDLYKLKDLNMIIELTGREEAANEIARSKPEHVRFMDHEAARLFWDIFQIEEQRIAERKRAEEKIEHLNLVLRAISNVNQLIIRERDCDRLLKGACDRLIETRGYYNVWIALLDKSGGFVTSAEAGLGEGFLPMVESLKRGELTDCGQRALSQSQVVVTKDPSFSCPDCPLSSMYSGRGGMTVRLEYGEKVYGILCASIPTDFTSDEEEQTLFNGVADDIAFAVHGIELEQERNRAQEKVRETAKKLQTIFDSVNDGLAIMDKSLTVQEVNKYRLEVLGLNRDQVISKKCYEAFQHRDKPCDICPVQPVFEKSKAVRMEKSAVLKDGTVKYFDAQGTPIFDDAGNVVQVVASVRDITDKKRTEEARRESEEKYKILVESSLTGIFIHQDGKYVFVNDRFAQIHGYTPEELLGKEYLTLIHPDERDTFVQVASKRLEGTAVSSRYEVKRLRKNGKTIWCEMMATRIEYGGRPAIMGNIIDITDRKQAEKVLQDHSKRLEAMVEERTEKLRGAQAQLVRREKLAALGQIAGGVAHELRNPLGAIKNTTYFLNMAIEEPRQEIMEALEIINKEVATSERIITSLLDFAHRKPSKRKRVKINDRIQETLSGITVPEDVEVVVQLDEAAPTIMADPDQLYQVFGNLIRNAIQAMPEGGRLTISSEASKPEWVTASFTDTGVGIDEEILGKVFEPLFTTKAKGIGLGLPLTRIIVEGHGGKIEVQSEIGKGATFTVFFPTTLADKRAKILVVDDEREIRDSITEAITRNRAYVVEQASNGTEALLKLGTYRPDLLILDIFMPEMDGLEVCRALINEPELSHIKVIIITGFPNHPKLNEVAELGFTDIFFKPVRLEKLLEEVDNSLKKAKTQTGNVFEK